MPELLEERLPELSNEEVNRAIALYKRLKEEDKRPKEEEETGSSELTDVNDDINKLRQLVYNLIQPPPVFKPGDAVRWKKGLKNKKYPKEDQVAVVIQQLDEPIIQGERDSGSPYFREPLDLKLGVLDDDGDLMVFHYDKQRFERVT